MNTLLHRTLAAVNMINIWRYKPDNLMKTQKQGESTDKNESTTIMKLRLQIRTCLLDSNRP